MEHARGPSGRTALRLALGFLALALPCASADAPKTVDVKDLEDLVRALASAGPGTRLKLRGGTYAGGLHLAGRMGLAGAPGNHLVIEAADSKNPPIFQGSGGTGDGALSNRGSSSGSLFSTSSMGASIWPNRSK